MQWSSHTWGNGFRKEPPSYKAAAQAARVFHARDCPAPAKKLWPADRAWPVRRPRPQAASALRARFDLIHFVPSRKLIDRGGENSRNPTVSQCRFIVFWSSGMVVWGLWCEGRSRTLDFGLQISDFGCQFLGWRSQVTCFTVVLRQSQCRLLRRPIHNYMSNPQFDSPSKI